MTVSQQFRCSLLALFATAWAGVASAELIAHYRFDDAGGMAAVDSSGAGTEAGLSNFPEDESQWVTGQIGGALLFDGVNDYAIAPDYNKVSSTLSISAWVNATSAPVWGTIVKNWGGTTGGQFHFGFNVGSGKISNYLQEQGGRVFPVLDPDTLSLGSWHHVAAVADGSYSRLYVDGAEVGAVPYDGTIKNPPLMQSLGIGVKTDDSGTRPDGGAPGYWNGMLDDLALWDHALSDADVANLYDMGLLGKSAVPEPSSCLLMALGALGSLTLAARRK